MTRVVDIWVYLSASPLLWLTATMAVFAASIWLGDRIGRPAWANPVALSVAVLAAILVATGTPYPVYFEGAQFIHFLLGPTTVALAVPLWRHRATVARAALPLAAALIAGCLVATLSALLIGRLFGLPENMLATLAPKSATAPIAMGISEHLGGIPSLTAVLVVLTGLTGALAGPALIRRLGITDETALGAALGTASHGIGTARAFQASELSGTMAGIALGLNGLLTAILVPLVWAWLSRYWH